MASAEHHNYPHHQSIRIVSKLFPESAAESEIPQIDPKSISAKESVAMMTVVNKENNSADLNTGVKGARGSVEKDLSPSVNDSNSSEARAFSPRPTTTLPGFSAIIVSNNNSNKTSSSSPPLPNRINTSAASSSPVSSLCSPPITTVGCQGSGSENPSAFSSAAAAIMGPRGDAGAHLLSQHLLQLNQMRPHQPDRHHSPPYKFFQDNNAFYQSRPLLTGNDLSEFKLNVQLKGKEAFATASEATSEEVVVDGNDDGAEDSQHNAVSWD